MQDKNTKKIDKNHIIKKLSEISLRHEDKIYGADSRIIDITFENDKINFIFSFNSAEEAKKNEPLLNKKCAAIVSEIDREMKSNVIITSETKDNTKAPPVKNLQNIRHLIAIASGKGGVGKSTVAVNIATALSDSGYSVGLLDADIYGPSIGKMMGNTKKPIFEGRMMIPHKNHNIEFISISSLTDNGKALIWRGPMVTKALMQLFLGTKWGELDYLIIDFPPGTGDVQLSIAQQFSISGAILVSTPQDVALWDVARALDMFRTLNIPVLGLIKNMSYFITGDSEKKHYPFGKGNIDDFCKTNTIELLGEIPLDPELSARCDAGIPSQATHKADKTTEIFYDIARKATKFINMVR